VFRMAPYYIRRQAQVTSAFFCPYRSWSGPVLKKAGADVPPWACWFAPKQPMLLLRDLPKYETLLSYAQRYPGVNPSAVEAYLNFLRTGSDVLHATESFLARKGTSQGRFTVLCLLNREPGAALCPVDLAKRAGVTKATMTGLLQGLEEDGLIKRFRPKEDGRMFLIRLTPKGQKYVDAILPELLERIGKMMEGLNNKERKTLLELLLKVSGKVPSLSDK
jgi:MarR family transcriptional regulator, negative regulator of the multidrug operon emrRAB